MSTALLTWTMVMGGWILPEVNPSGVPTAPHNAAPVSQPAATGLQGGAVRAPRSDPASRIASPYGQAQTPYMSPTQASRHNMPPIPTAADGVAPQASPYGQQPYGAPAGASPYAPQAGGAGRYQMPYAPTGAPGTPGYRGPAAARPATIGTGIVANPGISPEIVKPFSDYQQLPVISPYLNLERREGFDFDNYNTLVRPFVEQDYRNSQVQNELQALQNTIQQQQRSLQQMRQQTEVYQGTAQPRYFQDTGGYFPTGP